MKIAIGDVVKVGEKFGTIESCRTGRDGKTYEFQVTGDNLVDISEDDIDSKWIKWMPKKKKIVSEHSEALGGE